MGMARSWPRIGWSGMMNDTKLRCGDPSQLPVSQTHWSGFRRYNGRRRVLVSRYAPNNIRKIGRNGAKSPSTGPSGLSESTCIVLDAQLEPKTAIYAPNDTVPIPAILNATWTGRAALRELLCSIMSFSPVGLRCRWRSTPTSRQWRMLRLGGIYFLWASVWGTYWYELY